MLEEKDVKKLGHEEPLLFIKSPVIRKFVYTPVLLEESTSVFELAHTRQQERQVDSFVVDIPKATEETTTEKTMDPRIQRSLNYLNHPFRRELYQPLEVIMQEQVVKGKIHEVTDDLLWMKTEETLISISIDDIQEIHWKQQSFID